MCRRPDARKTDDEKAFRGCSYGCELARLSGLAHLGELL